MNDQTLRFLIKAKDEASGVVKGFGKELSGLRGHTDTLRKGFSQLVHGDLKGLATTLKTSGAGFTAFAAAATAGVALVVGAVAGLVVMFFKAKDAYEQWMGALDEAQDVTGMTTKATSLLAVQLRVVGSDIGSATKSLNFYTRGLDAAHQGSGTVLAGLKRLGVDLKDNEGRWRTSNAVLQEARNRLSEIEDPVKRAGVAAALFGKGWSELADWIDRSSEKMREYTKWAKEVGLVMGKDSTDAFQEYEENQHKISLAWEAVKINAYGSLVPIINDLMPKFIGAITTAAGWFGRFREEAEKEGILEALRKMVPGFEEVETVAHRVYSWLAENAPKAWAWIKENGPEIKTVFVGIGNAVATLGRLFDDSNPKVGESKSKFSQLKEVLFKLVVPFAAVDEAIKGTTKVIDKIKEKAGQLKDKLVSAFNGIKDSARSVWSKVTGFFSDGYTSVVGWINKLVTAVNKLLTSLHITPLKDATSSARTSGGGTFSSDTSSKLRSVSTPEFMDNGGTGADEKSSGGGGVASRISDWIGDMLGKIDWPSQPSGLLGSGTASFLLGKVKDAVGSILEKWGGPGRAIVEWAKTQIGKPYLWGATGPDAYDCSGLIYRAYATLGHPFPTRANWWNYGRLVSGANVRPGDVGFFAPNNSQGVKYGHVKMYAGGGQAIESASGGVHMSPWGGASEIRTYLGNGGVYVGERGPEAVLPLSDSRAMANLTKALSYSLPSVSSSRTQIVRRIVITDNSTINLRFAPGTTPAQAAAIADSRIAKAKASQGSALTILQRNQV